MGAWSREHEADAPAIATVAPAMRALVALAERVASTRLPVLIEGETGVGKELVARLVHARSGRKAFVPVNCGVLGGDLATSELFGYVRGAFTGAQATHPGLFGAADGGTLFLDEIGELPLEQQVKLLRVLESGEVRPVGGLQPQRVDVRVVAATHRSLALEVERGRFREDLFYRLDVVKLRVPPLRARREDIAHLAEVFRARFAPERVLAACARARLEAHAWPGNVRELENVIARGAALACSLEIRAEDLGLPGLAIAPAVEAPQSCPAPASAPAPGRAAASDSMADLTLDELERRHILRIVALEGGNKQRAAARLGISLRTVYERLRRYAAATPLPLA